MWENWMVFLGPAPAIREIWEWSSIRKLSLISKIKLKKRVVIAVYIPANCVWEKLPTLFQVSPSWRLRQFKKIILAPTLKFNFSPGHFFHGREARGDSHSLMPWSLIPLVILCEEPWEIISAAVFYFDIYLVWWTHRLILYPLLSLETSSFSFPLLWERQSIKRYCHLHSGLIELLKMLVSEGGKEPKRPMTRIPYRSGRIITEWILSVKGNWNSVVSNPKM